ncbi:MAG: hypothetical protein NWF07_04615, partial [Candidatus Bathyarchaeota archaeon]|nr:hypothetical protein [Candidatus Bathyarchaeota archaeon]
MSADAYVVPLTSIREGEINRVGGKAQNLGFLINKGFNVPNGFVLTTEAYHKFIDENNLSNIITEALTGNETNTASEKIQQAFLNSAIPPTISDEIIKQYTGLGKNEVAVRSSATSEDLKDASFAGQMDTYLNLTTIEDVLEHIKRCYASLWTDRAISYRSKQGINQDGVAIAVVVQEIVEPKSAGVLFTQDPVTGERNIVIESNYGYGESVVSGKATPDRFVVRRGKSHEIAVREIGTKELEAVKSYEGGVVFVEPSIERRELASLTDEEIFSLTSLGDKIETVYGAPQDIEWAIQGETPYLLQSRPITTINGNHETTPWTRGYSDDYWNDNVSPLFFELLGDHITEYVNVELNELLGYTKKGEAEMDQLLRLHKAHAYFNLEVLKRKVEYEIPTFLRNNDVLNYFPEGEGPYGKETMKHLPFRISKRINAEYRIRTRDPNGASNKTADAYDKWTHEELNPFWRAFDQRMSTLEGKSLDEYLVFADEVNDIMIAHYRLVRYGLPVHNIGMNLLSQYLLKRFIGEEKAAVTYPILVSGLKHSTSKTNDKLFELAENLRQAPMLRKLVLDIDSPEVLDAIKSQETSEAKRFLEAFDAFLYDYGCRGFTREPLYPRWSEAPEYVFDILKS